MKKIFLLFLLIFSLTSCLNKEWDELKNKKLDENTLTNNIIVWSWTKDNILDRIIKLWKDDYLVIKNFNWKKDYCKNNSSYICSLINNNYFYLKYYEKCKAFKDINSCENLKLEEDKKYCKGDFYFRELINKKNKDICNYFWYDFKYWNIMWSKSYNNKKLCMKFYDDLISKEQITNKDIKKFTEDIWAESTIYNQLVSIFLNKDNIFSVKDAFEINMRKWTLKCNKLNNINYIFDILSKIKENK